MPAELLIRSYVLVGMGMKDPLPTFTTFVERIRATHPNFAYVHAVESNMVGVSPATTASLEALRRAAGDIPYVAAGGFDRTSATSTVEKYGGLVAFGRHFIANVSCLLFCITGPGNGY
jgi:NADPH2 dehydrogenase